MATPPEGWVDFLSVLYTLKPVILNLSEFLRWISVIQAIDILWRGKNSITVHFLDFMPLAFQLTRNIKFSQIIN